VQSAHVQWYMAKAGSYPERKKRKASEAIARAKKRLYRAQQAVAKSLSEQNAKVCTGIVFVTYNTVDAAEACIEAISSKPAYFRGSGPLKCRTAPEPDDLIWENLQCSRTEQIVRMVLSSLIVTLQLILSTAAVSFAMVLLTQTTVDMNDKVSVLSATVVASTFGLCVGLIVVGLLSIMGMVPFLAYKMERHHTFAARETAIVLKLIFFQVLNVILPATVFVALHDWRITDEWYPTGGQIVLNGLLADFIS